jgi:hypothetical protein
VDVAAIRVELERSLAGTEIGEATVESDLVYGPERPVRIHVRKRSHRYDLDDAGQAVALAGRRRGWLAVADAIVAETGLNVNRAGVVFVSAVEGRDLAALAVKVAEASRAVFAELLEHRDAVAS